MNDPLILEHQLHNNEKRQLCLGETSAGRLLTMVITERKGKLRIVTAHPMHHKQREIYRQE